MLMKLTPGVQWKGSVPMMKLTPGVQWKGSVPLIFLGGRKTL